MKDHPLAAAGYDFFMAPLEFLGIGRWRGLLWKRVREEARVLDAGAGTGLNISYYRKDHRVVALDTNPFFLERARRRARDRSGQVEFVLGSVQDIPYADATFDSVVTTFLFCQVENPGRGMGELKRVLKPGGQLLMLEHVRSNGGWGRLMDVLAGPLYRMFGDHIARDTDLYASSAGFTNLTRQSLLFNVVKIIEAEKEA